MLTKRWTVLLAMLVISGLLLTACATPTPEVVEKVITQVVKETVKETVIVEGTPQIVEKVVTKEVVVAGEGCGGEIIMATNGDSQAVNPLYGSDSGTVWRTDQINEPLVYLDWKTQEPIPWLAESWEVSEDNTTYTFHLREGPKWPDGTPLTAQDFEFTLLTILSPDYTGPWQGLFQDLVEADKVIAGEAEQLEGLKVIDDRTFQLKLNQPNAPFLTSAARHLKPIPKHLLEGENLTPEHPFMQDPVGVGPYRLVEWVKGDHLTLEAKDDYWGEPVCAKRITDRYIPDMAALALAMESGDVDQIAPISPQDVIRMRDISSINVYEPPARSMDAVYFNLQNEILANPKVRQAVAFTLNQKEFTEKVLIVQAPVVTFVLPASWAYDPAARVAEQDMEQAKALMAEAGYADGFTIKVMTNAGNRNRERMSTYLQAQLAEIGVTAEVEFKEWSTFITEVTEGKFEVIVLSSSAGIPEPDNLFDNYHTDGARNYGKYSNPQLDDLLQQARITTDLEQRKELYGQAQQILIQDLPRIPSYEYLAAFATGANIWNVRPSPLGSTWDAKYWRKK